MTLEEKFEYYWWLWLRDERLFAVAKNHISRMETLGPEILGLVLQKVRKAGSLGKLPMSWIRLLKNLTGRKKSPKRDTGYRDAWIRWGMAYGYLTPE